ncbi:hypothetical protein B447_04512 [Thauera sp. 27]|uniref:efflux RND transporter periplasmic adaptor subunit n=1 Tax=Thauera sp. 27 TaxID=305700 RepID=UPI0002CEA1E6|nr:HlyD family efflux transporter periplasmic adaptor subunit [Thauera sp. 27]ENO82286.1 hypothetical protein B447_04512 [Thauera sp. 27]
MKEGRREAGELLLGRLLRLCTALAGVRDADKAGQLLANRIGEVLACERAVLVSVPALLPCQASAGVKPAERSVLADAIRIAAGELGLGNGPARLGHSARPAQVRSEVAGEALADALQRVIAAQGGTQILWWPLPGRDGEPGRHALWLERHRGRAWTDEEVLFAHRFGAMLGALMPSPQPPRLGARRRALLAGLAVVLVAALVPVPAAVTAPVQVVAAEPRHVFSALDGVIATLEVAPGQQVEPGDLLLRMDTRVLEKNVDEARQSLAVAQAELARVRAASHYDASARARVAVTQIELERAQLELDFQLAQLERAELRSELSGQVLLEDPDRLPGAAVRMGERLLSIADTRVTRLRIMVPLADFSLVDEGAPVQVTLDRSPLSALSAQVVRRGYSVQLSDDQLPSIAVDADWRATPPAVLPGARGTARITGERIPLAQQLLRKPLQALRRAWGL